MKDQPVRPALFRGFADARGQDGVCVIPASDAPAAPRGFTLIELLVVIGIIAVLISILLPSLNRVREQSNRTVCLSNLHNAGNSLLMYANQNNGWLPIFKGPTAWLWDLPFDTRDAMMHNGMVRTNFYCPSNEVQNDDTLWTYQNSFCVTGYFWLMFREDGGGHQIGPPLIPPTQYQQKITHKGSSDLAIAADATLSTNGNFSDVKGGWPGIHRSNHLGVRTRCDGGNILFLDGHAAWRDITEMKIRCQLGHDEWF